MRLFSSLRPSTSSSRSISDSDEATIPLTSLDPDASFESAPTSGRRAKSRTSTTSSSTCSRAAFPLRRILLLAVIVVATYKLATYAYYADYADRLRGKMRDKLDAYKDSYAAWRGYGRLGEAWEMIPISPVVDVLGRKYRSAVEREGQDKFQSWKGLPYAQPPTGERRFRTALPLEQTEEREKVMSEWDVGCLRPKPREDGQDGPKDKFDGHEDCLKLNVFSPLERANTTLLPVLFWIHGGGFVGGSSNEAKYHARDLMQLAIDELDEPFVFVSINYRLGALGFTSSPPPPGPEPTPPHIPVQAPTDLDLNVGLKDQIIALQWVQQHISQFGGDRKKVTLVGHSAGAMSVGLHMLYTGTRDGNEELFRGAFMLSGAPTSFPVPWPHDASARTLHPLPGPARCPSPVQRVRGPPDNTELLACLRKLSVPDLYQATRVLTDDTPVNAWFPYYPVLEGEWGSGPTGVDGKRGGGGWLDVRPSERITRGEYTRIPVVLGSVTDEATRFVHEGIKEGEQEFLDVIRDVFEFTYGAIEDLLEPILSYYPSPPSTSAATSNFQRISSFLGDILFQAPRRHFLRETPKDFGEPSWAFSFEEPRKGASERLGNQHGADLPSWFNHPEEDDEPMVRLSQDMASYLINFVTRLDPNGPGLHHWPQYTMDRLTLQLRRGNVTVKGDNDRLEAMRFLNINNPVFAR
ncbi:uncharacterized protein JCM15063_004772 [Sporobolomyces koalae]|uniref:uncharacterized protein n=1 Tax=Sporobolomyces koalae TaxID=500713 RepID=UPI0031829009